jgi:hypothetical protein
MIPGSKNLMVLLFLLIKIGNEVSVMLKKPIGIGIENYKRLVEKPYYYVDKTLMIKDLLDKDGTVNLFTRPRRFGKTLTLSMIKTFFEMELDNDVKQIDNRYYFDGMKIMETGDEYLKHMGRYPVISMSLKSARQPNFQMAYESLVDEIIKEYIRHKYILDSECLTEEYHERYYAIMNRRAKQITYAKSFAFLSECLKKYHNTNVIILLDEYDVPLENAFFNGFYNEMADFIRSLFESALKTNDCLQMAVVTGCLHISKESIFTGLNNLKINSILDNGFSEYFGFTQPEVEAMLDTYGLSSKIQEAKDWYDGYLFGNTEVYNPWSIINYVDTATNNPNAFPRPYWSNTSSNGIIRELIEQADDLMKDELEELIAGGTIEKPIHEDVTYGEIHDKQENLWNFLFFTGYLKAVSQRLDGESIYMTMNIPNTEVKSIYKNKIWDWFERQIKCVDFSELYRALLGQDTDKVQDLLRRQLRQTISYNDNRETFYHGFLLGLLSGLQEYRIRSNQESGNGRPDLLLLPLDETRPAVIMELKHVNKFTQMEKGCEEALEQIERQDYAAAPLDEGYENILKYGICFCKKSCMVKIGT